MLTVHVAGTDGPGVLDAPRRLSAGRVVAVDGPPRLHQQVTRLWEERPRPWLEVLDAGRSDSVPARIGYAPALGSRPGSPGVHRDNPLGDEDVPDEVWASFETWARGR